MSTTRIRHCTHTAAGLRLYFGLKDLPLIALTLENRVILQLRFIATFASAFAAAAIITAASAQTNTHTSMGGLIIVLALAFCYCSSSGVKGFHGGLIGLSCLGGSKTGQDRLVRAYQIRRDATPADKQARQRLHATQSHVYLPTFESVV